jgi:hypothetical protein
MVLVVVAAIVAAAAVVGAETSGEWALGNACC